MRTESCDVVVIGGGLSGLGVAGILGKAGKKVISGIGKPIPVKRCEQNRTAREEIRKAAKDTHLTGQSQPIRHYCQRAFVENQTLLTRFPGRFWSRLSGFLWSPDRVG